MVADRPRRRGAPDRGPHQGLDWLGPRRPDAEPPDWSDFAVLYRKHRHREAIVARLRDEAIPYTVVGGLSLFDTPEIRDLEQSLRAIADPHQDVALVRMMSAAPWRLDALEILQIARMARYDYRHLIDVIHEVVESGERGGGPRRPTDEEVRRCRREADRERERRERQRRRWP